MIHPWGGKPASPGSAARGACALLAPQTSVIALLLKAYYEKPHQIMPYTCAGHQTTAMHAQGTASSSDTVTGSLPCASIQPLAVSTAVRLIPAHFARFRPQQWKGKYLVCT